MKFSNLLMGLAGGFALGELYHQLQKKDLVDKVLADQSRGKTVLNVGAGTGRIGQITFLGDKKCDTNPVVPGVEYGDIRNLPYPDKSFDIVIASHVIEHLPPEDIPKAINELYRVAREKIYVLIPNPIFLQTWLYPNHRSVIINGKAYKNNPLLNLGLLGLATALISKG